MLLLTTRLGYLCVGIRRPPRPIVLDELGSRDGLMQTLPLVAVSSPWLRAMAQPFHRDVITNSNHTVYV